MLIPAQPSCLRASCDRRVADRAIRCSPVPSTMARGLLAASPSNPRPASAAQAMPVAGIEALDSLASAARSPNVLAGGETFGRARLDAFIGDALGHYGDRSRHLAADAMSRISPFLHFGCLSPLETATRRRPFPRGCGLHPPAVLARLLPSGVGGTSRISVERSPRPAVTGGTSMIKRSRHGATAGPGSRSSMRGCGSLRRRASCTTGPGWSSPRSSPRTSTSTGGWAPPHFMDLLVDGDVANNQLNWQWVAGTGTDARPNRVFNPLLQGRRFDPRRRIRAALRAGAGRPRRADVHSWPDAGGRRRRLPGADRRPRRSDRAVPIASAAALGPAGRGWPRSGCVPAISQSWARRRLSST